MVVLRNITAGIDSGSSSNVATGGCYGYKCAGRLVLVAVRTVATQK